MTICAYVMFVSRVAILVTMSRDIHYGTVHGLPSMKIPVMEAVIQGVVKSYAVRGFLVKFIFVDLHIITGSCCILRRSQSKWWCI